MAIFERQLARGRAGHRIVILYLVTIIRYLFRLLVI